MQDIWHSLTLDIVYSVVEYVGRDKLRSLSLDGKSIAEKLYPELRGRTMQDFADAMCQKFHSGWVKRCYMRARRKKGPRSLLRTSWKATSKSPETLIVPSVRCKATCATGKRCKRRTRSAHGYCSCHLSQKPLLAGPRFVCAANRLLE